MEHQRDHSGEHIQVRDQDRENNMLDYNEDKNWGYSYTNYKCHAMVDKYLEEKDVSKDEKNIVNQLKREAKGNKTTGTLREFTRQKQ